MKKLAILIVIMMVTGIAFAGDRTIDQVTTELKAALWDINTANNQVNEELKKYRDKLLTSPEYVKIKDHVNALTDELDKLKSAPQAKTPTKGDENAD